MNLQIFSLHFLCNGGKEICGNRLGVVLPNTINPELNTCVACPLTGTISEVSDFNVIVRPDSTTKLRCISEIKVGQLRTVEFNTNDYIIGYIPSPKAVEIAKKMSIILTPLKENEDSEADTIDFKHGSCHEVLLNEKHSTAYEKVIVVSANNYNQRSESILVVPLHLPMEIYCVDKRFFQEPLEPTLDFNPNQINMFLSNVLKF